MHFQIIYTLFLLLAFVYIRGQFSLIRSFYGLFYLISTLIEVVAKKTNPSDKQIHSGLEFLSHFAGAFTIGMASSGSNVLICCVGTPWILFVYTLFASLLYEDSKTQAHEE